MNLIPLSLAGAYLIEPQRIEDERGFFARSWCQQTFADIGLEISFVQASISYTRTQGTVRGMHYQRPPSTECKLVRCTNGKVSDVIADIRPDSKTFMQCVAFELSAENRHSLLIPTGFAHGFQALTDDVELFYEMTDIYQPELAGGFRSDDPAVNIRWPLEVTVINDRDAAYDDVNAPDFDCFRELSERGR